MNKVRHVLGISGGKDSAALAIYLKDKYPMLDIDFYTCDTKCELAETERLVERLRSYLGKITTLQAAKDSPEPTPFDHFLKINGGFLPSVQQRWCTQKMKLAEFEKYVGGDFVISYVGIRGDEDRDGYVSTKSNIQSVFPFRKNIWSLDVINKVLGNASIDKFNDCYRSIANDDVYEQAQKFIVTPLTKDFFYSKKLNALLDIDIKTFNHAVFTFLKEYTDYPVGKLDSFPLLDNEEVLYKEDIFIIIVSAMAVFIATKWFYKTKHKKKYLIIIGIYYLLIALIPFIYSNIFLFSSFYKYGISLLINLIPVNILILYNAVSKIS